MTNQINGLVQDCCNSSALAMELLQTYTKTLKGFMIEFRNKTKQERFIFNTVIFIYMEDVLVTMPPGTIDLDDEIIWHDVLLIRWHYFKADGKVLWNLSVI